MINTDNVMSMECSKADLQDAMGRSPRVEDGASSSLAVSVDQRVDLGV